MKIKFNKSFLLIFSIIFFNKNIIGSCFLENFNPFETIQLAKQKQIKIKDKLLLGSYAVFLAYNISYFTFLKKIFDFKAFLAANSFLVFFIIVKAFYNNKKQFDNKGQIKIVVSNNSLLFEEIDSSQENFDSQSLIELLKNKLFIYEDKAPLINLKVKGVQITVESLKNELYKINDKNKIVTFKNSNGATVSAKISTLIDYLSCDFENEANVLKELDTMQSLNIIDFCNQNMVKLNYATFYSYIKIINNDLNFRFYIKDFSMKKEQTDLRLYASADFKFEFLKFLIASYKQEVISTSQDNGNKDVFVESDKNLTSINAYNKNDYTKSKSYTNFESYQKQLFEEFGDKCNAEKLKKEEIQIIKNQNSEFKVSFVEKKDNA